MILLLVGVLLGGFVTIVVLGLISAADEEDERRENYCRECPYKPFDDGSHNCARCHDYGEV